MLTISNSDWCNSFFFSQYTIIWIRSPKLYFQSFPDYVIFGFCDTVSQINIHFVSKCLKVVEWQRIHCQQISVFMTHFSNYGNDRLALLVFDSLTKYLMCWTNLKLSCEHPTDLAQRYFKMYPNEEDPIWQVKSLKDVKLWFLITHQGYFQKNSLNALSLVLHLV